MEFDYDGYGKSGCMFFVFLIVGFILELIYMWPNLPH
jgi:hypothetical protein